MHIENREDTVWTWRPLVDDSLKGNSLCESMTVNVARWTSPFDGRAAATAIGLLGSLLEASDGDAEESFRSCARNGDDK
jgi:hypothetical protein